MWKQYQFFRYSLPGFLFFTYLAILLVPQLAVENLIGSFERIVAVFGSVIIASPVIGYLIYSPFNLVYEYHYAKKNRNAIEYLEEAEFIKDPDLKKIFKRKIKSYAQKKEFIDLVQYLTYKSEPKKASKSQPDVEISPKVLEEHNNHLNNFAARIVSGGFTPLVVYATIGFVWFYCSITGNFAEFTTQFNWLLFGVTSIPIVVFSFLLLVDANRVLEEFFELENYVIRSKKREINKLVKQMFS